MSLFLMYCCMAHTLFVPFLEISRVSGDRNPSFTPSLIIITVLTNNSSIFCSSLKFLHFDLLSGDGGTTTWTIFMCHLFCFSFCWWGLICRFILGTVFSFQVFFPTLNSLFVILFHFQERKKAQQACQPSRRYQKSPSLNRFHLEKSG